MKSNVANENECQIGRGGDQIPTGDRPKDRRLSQFFIPAKNEI
nr:MAG TPA: hypothetical protein [Caudoviricetes sp.]